MLAEVTTTALSRQEQPSTFNKSKDIAKRGGKVANNARNDYEKTIGHKVVSQVNAKNKHLLKIKSQTNN